MKVGTKSAICINTREVAPRTSALNLPRTMTRVSPPTAEPRMGAPRCAFQMLGGGESALRAPEVTEIATEIDDRICACSRTAKNTGCR